MFNHQKSNSVVQKNRSNDFVEIQEGKTTPKKRVQAGANKIANDANQPKGHRNHSYHDNCVAPYKKAKHLHS